MDVFGFSLGNNKMDPFDKALYDIESAELKDMWDSDLDQNLPDSMKMEKLDSIINGWNGFSDLMETNPTLISDVVLQDKLMSDALTSLKQQAEQHAYKPTRLAKAMANLPSMTTGLLSTTADFQSMATSVPSMTTSLLSTPTKSEVVDLDSEEDTKDYYLESTPSQPVNTITPTTTPTSTLQPTKLKIVFPKKKEGSKYFLVKRDSQGNVDTKLELKDVLKMSNEMTFADHNIARASVDSESEGAYSISIPDDGFEETYLPATQAHEKNPSQQRQFYVIKDEPVSPSSSAPPSPRPSFVKVKSGTEYKLLMKLNPEQARKLFHVKKENSIKEEEKSLSRQLSVKIENRHVFSPSCVPYPTPPSSSVTSPSSSDSEMDVAEIELESPRMGQRNLQQASPPNKRLIVESDFRQPDKSRRKINTELFNNKQLKGSGPLCLTDEERKNLLQEGLPIPTRLPLSKAEEKALKKIRRKIKNKISAQESRKKRKEYVEGLERRTEELEAKNLDYEKKICVLEQANSLLVKELAKLQELINSDNSPANHTA